MNGQCVTIQDGYYYVSAVCVALGIVTCVLYVVPTARRLEGEPCSLSLRFGGLLRYLFSVACGKMAGILYILIYVAQQHVTLALHSVQYLVIWKTQPP